MNLRLQQKHDDPNFKETVAEWIESTAVDTDNDEDSVDDVDDTDDTVDDIDIDDADVVVATGE